MRSARPGCISAIWSMESSVCLVLPLGWSGMNQVSEAGAALRRKRGWAAVSGAGGKEQASLAAGREDEPPLGRSEARLGFAHGGAKGRNRQGCFPSKKKKETSAMTYSPRPLPAQYHRR